MPRKWKDEEYQYQQGYIKDNIKFVSVPFNMKNDEDVMLYEYLNQIDEKKASHIKRLIRNDMQGPVPPKVYPETRYNGELIACGDCRHELIQKKPNFCPYCGKPIKWE